MNLTFTALVISNIIAGYLREPRQEDWLFQSARVDDRRRRGARHHRRRVVRPRRQRRRWRWGRRQRPHLLDDVLRIERILLGGRRHRHQVGPELLRAPEAADLRRRRKGGHQEVSCTANRSKLKVDVALEA